MGRATDSESQPKVHLTLAPTGVANPIAQARTTTQALLQLSVDE